MPKQCTCKIMSKIRTANVKQLVDSSVEVFSEGGAIYFFGPAQK
jgi:hypothetical protein